MTHQVTKNRSTHNHNPTHGGGSLFDQVGLGAVFADTLTDVACSEIANQKWRGE